VATIYSATLPIKVKPETKERLQREADAAGKLLLVHCRDKLTANHPEANAIPSIFNNVVSRQLQPKKEPRWEESY
jgi:hypothetical protein